MDQMKIKTLSNINRKNYFNDDQFYEQFKIISFQISPQNNYPPFKDQGNLGSCQLQVIKIQNWRDSFTSLSKFLKQKSQQLKDKKNHEIITYNNEQKSFCIKSIRRFTQQVMPKYFIHKNYSSFVRQVNLYNFRKISQQGKQQVYQNQDFNIHNIKSLIKIKRKSVHNEKVEINKNKDSKSQHNSQDMEAQSLNIIEKPPNNSFQQESSSESQQNSSSYEQNESNNCQQKIKMSNFDSIQLKKQQGQKIKKRLELLHNNIKIQKMVSQKLVLQNMSLRNECHQTLVANSTSYAFNKGILQKINKLIDSQFYSAKISRQTELKLKKYNEAQIAKINNEQNLKKIKISKCHFQHENKQDQGIKQSRYTFFVKELLKNQQIANNIPILMRFLYSYVQNGQNMFHPSKQIDSLPQRNSGQQNEFPGLIETVKMKQLRADENILVKNNVMKQADVAKWPPVAQNPKTDRQPHHQTKSPRQGIQQIQVIQKDIINEQRQTGLDKQRKQVVHTQSPVNKSIAQKKKLRCQKNDSQQYLPRK